MKPGNSGIDWVIVILVVGFSFFIGRFVVPALYEAMDRRNPDNTDSVQNISVIPTDFVVQDGKNVLVTRRHGEYIYTANHSPVMWECHRAKVDIDRLSGTRVIYEAWMHTQSCDEYWRD